MILLLRPSVATVVTNAFQQNWIMKPRKLAKTVRIFINVEHIKITGSHDQEVDEDLPELIDA